MTATVSNKDAMTSKASHDDMLHVLSDEDDGKMGADINERYLLLVERYRDLKEKSNLLKVPVLHFGVARTKQSNTKRIIQPSSATKKAGSVILCFVAAWLVEIKSVGEEKNAPFHCYSLLCCGLA